MPRLVAAIQKEKRRFKRLPIGPLGSCIELARGITKEQAGVVEAEVRFKPVIRSTRKRELPDDLKSPQSSGPQFRLNLGLTGGSMRVDF